MIHPDIRAFYEKQGCQIDSGLYYYWVLDRAIATVESSPVYLFDNKHLTEEQMLRLIKLKALL